MTTSTAKKLAGNGAKPSTAPSGVTTSSVPTSTLPTTLAMSARLGRLLKGEPAVRMTKITSVWVASDSMNQPARNSSGPARKTPSSTAKVRKS